MLDRTPHVFISYSWTSEVFQQSVKELATRLVYDGVDVKLDIWDLKDGQDKYAFMEQCVTSSDIDKVLIICDKGYEEKANKRQGGVGDETTIISAELYGNAEQEKFIPIVMERNEQGEPYMPAYLKSRMYKDLTGENYAKGYESLLRNIYDQPAERKPELGNRPSWLEKDESSALFPLKEAEKKVATAQLGNFKVTVAQDFIDVYLDSLKVFYKKEYSNNQEYLDDFMEMKEYRDIFLDYLKKLTGNISDLGEFLADTFEKMYNTLYSIETFVPGASSCSYEQFDIFRLHIWELFVCTTTYLLHIEAYKDINRLLVHTYFLRTSPLGSEVRPYSYEKIRFRSHMMEDLIKPQMPKGLNNKYTLVGHYLCNEREYLPIYSGKKIAEADLFLYQVYDGLDIEELRESFCWFPTCYIYAEEYNSMWKKLISRRFCEKIMPVFGVSTIEQLKERISKCVPNRDARYSSGFAMPASAILNWIKIDEIATLP